MSGQGAWWLLLSPTAVLALLLVDPFGERQDTRTVYTILLVIAAVGFVLAVLLFMLDARGRQHD